MLEKVTFQTNGNIKLGKSVGTFSKLYSNKLFNVYGIGLVQGSCGKYCNGCSDKCYVKSSYRNGSVIKRHGMNTYLLREDLEKGFEDMGIQYDRKWYKPTIFRINQSGELESARELELWFDFARHRKETTFYLYTKNFDALREVLAHKRIPSNFYVLISIWHDYGQKEYEEFKHLKNIKAFVYLDGYDYPFEVKNLCKAYDENGKLDHNITCNKCRKCFNKSSKIIGCYEH